MPVTARRKAILPGWTRLATALADPLGIGGGCWGVAASRKGQFSVRISLAVGSVARLLSRTRSLG